MVEDGGWPLRRAAERFQVSPTTAQRWATRYRAMGEVGMEDRSSRPRHSPRRTPTRAERRIIKVRVTRRWGPARIAGLLDLVPSTVHRVLTRFGPARLSHLDRATGHVIRRYERDRPGELVHVDIKKLGNIPDGGGHKTLGRQAGRKNRANAGYSYIHTAVDDHSRLAYSEILADERKDTATAFSGSRPTSPAPGSPFAGALAPLPPSRPPTPTRRLPARRVRQTRGAGTFGLKSGRCISIAAPEAPWDVWNLFAVQRGQAKRLASEPSTPFGALIGGDETVVVLVGFLSIIFL